MEPAVDFNRIDCSLTPDLCEELHVESVPGIMFLPAKNIAYNGTYQSDKLLIDITRQMEV